LLIDISRAASETAAVSALEQPCLTSTEKLNCWSVTECELIAGLATDQRASYENEKLGLEYRQIAEELKSIVPRMDKL
jgi:hypothetical protein